MPCKGGLQRRQQRQTLFAQGGQRAANASKGLSPSQAAETARDSLLHGCPAQVSLGQMIVKVHPQVLQEGEDGPDQALLCQKHQIAQHMHQASACSQSYKK